MERSTTSYARESPGRSPENQTAANGFPILVNFATESSFPPTRRLSKPLADTSSSNTE